MNTLLNTQELISWLLSSGFKIIGVVFGAVFIYWTYKAVVQRAVKVFVGRTYGRDGAALDKRVKTITEVFQGAGKVALFGIALLMILSEAGLDIGPLLAGAGILGLAVGFGAQSLVKDVLGGLFILLEDQFREGDVVKVGGVAGLVEDINLRRTVLRDLDGAQHFVPNGEITVASNLSKFWARVNLDVPVPYEADLDRVTVILNEVGKSLAEDATFGPMLKTPPQVEGVDDFAESAIIIKVLGDTQPLQQWNVMRELRRRIKRAFDKEGISIPYPHRVIISSSPQA